MERSHCESMCVEGSSIINSVAQCPVLAQEVELTTLPNTNKNGNRRFEDLAAQIIAFYQSDTIFCAMLIINDLRSFKLLDGSLERRKLCHMTLNIAEACSRSKRIWTAS